MIDNNINKVIDKFKMENNNNFECLLIKPTNISDISWRDLDYSKKISEIDIYTSITTNNNNFIEIITTKLEIDKFTIKNVSIKNEIIAEDIYYLYELLYIDLIDNKEYHKEEHINGVANLLNTNGDNIYSNALLLKTYLPSLNDSMIFVDAKISDIQQILHNRINTKIVTWDSDDNWKEIEARGDLNIIANNYFDDCNYIKLEIGFLLHNINIWYIIDNSGEKNICGALINKPIEKCIWFTMKTDELRGNLSLDEVKKIIYLSNKLTTYITPSELIKEKNDNFERKIINNKYKVLDYLYNKYI